MDETTTGAVPTDGAAAAAQPVEGAQATAVQPTEPQSQSQPAQADDTAAWLQSKGLDPNDPESFQKLVGMAYNSEKQMTKATQRASELERALTPQSPQQPDGSGVDPAMQEFIQDYKRDKLIKNFQESHSDWQQYESSMEQLLYQSSPSGYTYGQLVNAGIIGLDAVYAIAKASAPVNTDQIKQQAQQEVLQTLANTQRAGGSNAHASAATPSAPANDPIMDAIKRSRG